MKSLYARYLLERTNWGVVENDKGFIVYSIKNQECFIRDIFVLPEFRKSREATKMADEVTEIAKDHGCTYLSCTVCPEANGADMSLKVVMAYGFKLHSANNNLIILKKDLI